ncbi:MAG: Ig-like domain-containing protein, partial [Thermoplasmatota archaeon]
GIEMSPTLLWEGGDPEGETVLYTVYLGSDGVLERIADNITTTTVTVQKLQPYTRYSWYVVATDVGGMQTQGDTWQFTTMDVVAPMVSIEAPEHQRLYVRNKSYLFPRTTVIGKITVEVTAEDADSGVERVDFYVDGELMATDTEAPYQWWWNEDTILDTHEIRVVAVDRDGNAAESSLSVLVLNLFY